MIINSLFQPGDFSAGSTTVYLLVGSSICHVCYSSVMSAVFSLSENASFLIHDLHP